MLIVYTHAIYDYQLNFSSSKRNIINMHPIRRAAPVGLDGLM